MRIFSDDIFCLMGAWMFLQMILMFILYSSEYLFGRLCIKYENILKS